MNFLQVLAYMEMHFPGTPITLDPGDLRRVLEREQAVQGTGDSEWIDGRTAHQITKVPERTLRSKAERWEGLQNAGNRPEIRVCSTSDRDGAHWRYHKGDCLAYAASHRQPTLPTTVPAPIESGPAPDPEDTNSADSIDLAARRYAARARRS